MENKKMVVFFKLLVVCITCILLVTGIVLIFT